MKVRAATLSAAVSLLVGGLVPVAAPAAADTGPIPLAMTGFADIVLDEAHGQLFLSPGRGGSGVRVTDLAGGDVRTIDGLPGASGMALTPDGRSLWVAVPTAGLSRVDTSTLTVVQRVPLPTGVCAGDVAVVDSRLVYGYSCSTYAGTGGYGGIGVVDAESGTSYGTVTSGPFSRPVVASGPAGQVYAADSELSPTGLHLYDVTGAAPVTVAARVSVCSNLRDLSASPDGSRVVTSCGGTYEHTVYTSDKLELSGSYPTGAYPMAGAWSADSTTFVAGIDSAYEPDVHVYRQGWNAPARIAELGGTQRLVQPRGVAVSANGARVWAVAGTSSTGLALHVLDVPGADTGLLSLTATPSAFYAGRATTLTGRLGTVAGASLPGELLRVSRSATGEVPVALPGVTTGADGSFTFSDNPPKAGSYVYAVSRDADAARAETSVLAWRAEGTLLLDLTRGTSGGTPVHGTLRLSYDGSTDPAGMSVTLTRQGSGVLTPLPPVTLGTDGSATFTDSAPPAGDVAYTATVAANGIHPPATATATTTVLTATKLSAVAPSSVTVGTPVVVSGVLAAPAGPLAGRTVAVLRSGCGTTWSASVDTSSDGRYAVTDDAPPVGTCAYTASYAGGGGDASSTASAKTSVTLVPTTLVADTPSPTVAGAPVGLTGDLTADGAAVGGATLTVLRSGCSTTGWQGSARTAADGSWSLTDPAAPGGTCTYRVSYGGDSTRASATRSIAAAVAFRTPDLTVEVARGTGNAKKLVHITGRLGATYENRTLTITAQPSAGAETVVAHGTVDSTGRFSATYTSKSTTTYRARFAGDDWYAVATAQRTQ